MASKQHLSSLISKKIRCVRCRYYLPAEIATCPECGLDMNSSEAARQVAKHRIRYFTLILIAVAVVSNGMTLVSCFPRYMAGRNFSVGFPWAFWWGDGDCFEMHMWSVLLDTRSLLATAALWISLYVLGVAAIAVAYRRKQKLYK